ncbi:Imm1 family immunity protein [Streptomyces filamentosus]|uniref:Imm1 family immunity protein n=1 Tax=Streptomyces filamentosus TaxID=67294 RepID=UPI0033F353E3
MILEFRISGEVHHISEGIDIVKAIERTLQELEAEREVPVGFFPGTTASFHVFNIPAGSEVPRSAENSLVVGINRDTGYGGMTWAGEEIPEDPDQIWWILSNENPPQRDPRVIADQGYPLWYDKRNVLPLDAVKKALEEFCFGNGKRPQSVQWEPGTVNGQRLDAEY